MTEQPGKAAVEMWQEYAQAYSDAVIEGTRRALGFSLHLREQLDTVMGEMAEQVQALGDREQEIIFGAAESWQAQRRRAAERLSKLLHPAAPQT